MITIVNGIERDVRLLRKDSKGYFVYKVGKAIAIWREGQDRPFVRIKGASTSDCMRAAYKVKAFIDEYNYWITQPIESSKLSFEGEGQTDSPYKETQYVPKYGYISGVPEWMRKLKLKQLCSGPKRTYVRGIRIPQEHKEMVQKYAPLCAKCLYRENCDTPCLYPEVNSSDTITTKEAIA